MTRTLRLNLIRGLALMALVLTVPLLMSNRPASVPVNTLDDFIKNRYDNLVPLNGVKPAYDLFEKGMIGYLNLKADGNVINNEKLTLIDFRLSSRKKRMWIIDLDTDRVLYHRLVAHGKNTGEEYAQDFSNIRHSNQSSLGFYLTGENYMGKHGFSLRLDGMEEGFNSLARSRAIVLHAASYVSLDFVKEHGRLGRSFGCPAIATNMHKEIIRTLENQSVLFIYAANEYYDENTHLNNRMRAWHYLQNRQNFAKAGGVSP